MSKKQNNNQLILDLPHRAAMERDDFLIAGSNEQAVMQIDSWPDWPYPVLILVGPPGSGKSHLANVWQQMSSADLIHLNNLDKENIVETYGGRSLILEDIPGDILDETLLFHLINMARETQGSILITSHDFPTSWQISLPDLESRLRAAPVAELKEPDDYLLRAILVKLFSDRQLRVDEKLINFLLSRMERSVSFARQLVGEIDELALERKSNITRTLVSEVLERL